jgi:hypothetical protein
MPPAALVADDLSPRVYFGGPDQPARALRDVLKARIEAAPPGSTIDWATYYFRDQALAQALIDAQKRGVQVRVVLEKRPRLAKANRPVMRSLRDGLEGGLKLHKTRRLVPSPAELHAKIYAFSGPAPAAFVGSFNPSGSEPEDVRINAKIGDQDRGENVLVELRSPKLVDALRRQARRGWKTGLLTRLSPRQNRRVKDGNTSLYFYPRLNTDVVEHSLDRLGPGDTVEGTVSHMAVGPFTTSVENAARRGVKIELAVHDTARRVPDDVVKRLAAAGVDVHRYRDPDDLPMHAKILVVSHKGVRTAWFGSYNFNFQSRFLNDEVLVRSTDAHLVDQLEARVEAIFKEAAGRRIAAAEPPEVAAN